MKLTILKQTFGITAAALIIFMPAATRARLGNETAGAAISDEAIEDEQTELAAEERSLIIGGRDANVGEYPFYVKFRGCGGSFLGNGIVLTSAHCSVNKGDEVRVGAYYYNRNKGALCTTTVADFKRHPDYNPTNNYRDMMLLLLADRCDTTATPVVLASTVPDDEDPLVGIGMGITNLDPITRPEVLQEVGLKRVLEKFCNKDSYNFWTSDKICYSFQTSSWAGQMAGGDSGGPVLDSNGRQVVVHSSGTDYGHNNVNYGPPVALNRCWIDFMACQMIHRAHLPGSCYKYFYHGQTGKYLGVIGGKVKLVSKGDGHIVKLALRYDKRLIIYAPGTPYHLMHLDEMSGVSANWWRNDPGQQWEPLPVDGTYDCVYQWFRFKNLGSGHILDYASYDIEMDDWDTTIYYQWFRLE